MGLTQSLNIALSGLTATARGAEVVASNLANKDVMAYGKRSIELSTARLGGVRVDTVLRHGNPALIAERRLAQADTAAGATLLTFHQSLEGWIGAPGTEGAMGERINRFETALTAAAADPGATARLLEVFDAATALAAGLRHVTEQIQSSRQAADTQIRSDVEVFNDALARVAELNRTIARMVAQGQDIAGLLDQRQALVDRIADIVPLREVQRDGGQILLYSAGGATLLDGQPAVLATLPSGIIRAESAPLPGLMLNGQPVSLSADSQLSGGRLAANFMLRDTLGPAAQAALDQLGAELIFRLEGADNSRASGTPALFTDAGASLDPMQTQGIAGRVMVNVLVNPANGGDLWRLRAGLGATTPGEVGDGRLLTGLADALARTQPLTTGSSSGGWQSLASLAGSLLSETATARLSHERTVSFANTRSNALTQMEAEGGVDSDHELQMLLRIETAYAANARVIQTVDRMLATLLEI